MPGQRLRLTQHVPSVGDWHPDPGGEQLPANYRWLSNGNTATPVLIFTSAWKGFPFFTVMFLAAMQTVPRELYEAATAPAGRP